MKIKKMVEEEFTICDICRKSASISVGKYDFCQEHRGYTGAVEGLLQLKREDLIKKLFPLKG